MKNACKCALRSYMQERFLQTRTEEKLTQVKFSEALMMDTRSYAALEHGDSLCCTLTFILFLAFHCKDVDSLVCDLRRVIKNVMDDDELT